MWGAYRGWGTRCWAALAHVAAPLRLRARPLLRVLRPAAPRGVPTHAQPSATPPPGGQRGLSRAAQARVAGLQPAGVHVSVVGVGRGDP